MKAGGISAGFLVLVVLLHEGKGSGEHDDDCGPGQTRAAHDLCTGIEASRKHHLTAHGCGHYGIFSGTR